MQNNNDMIMCEFKFTNQTSDIFICRDRHSNSFLLPPTDSIDNIEGPFTTNTVYYWNQTHPKLVYTQTTFERLLATGDLTQDTLLRDADRVEACWAYG